MRMASPSAASIGLLGIGFAVALMLRRWRRLSHTHIVGRKNTQQATWRDFPIGSDVEYAFEPRVAALASTDRDQACHYVLHTHAGLESFAAKEVSSVEGCTNVVPVFGKVLFQSTASPHELRNVLRSAEDLSLLCWASPVSIALSAYDANVAQPPQQPSALADEFTKFYAARDTEAALWLRKLEALLRDRALPALESLAPMWCTAVGLGDGMASSGSDGKPLGFRVTVKRSGKSTTAPGVTSVCMEQLLGGLLVERLGWRVDLKRAELNVVMQWCDAQATLELPLRRYAPRGLPAAEALRPWLPAGALRGPVSWALLRMALEELARDGAGSAAHAAAAGGGAGLAILDPCVGRGGLLVEAALSIPQCRFLMGVDDDESQLAAAVSAARRAGVSSRLALVHGDCTRLPLVEGSIDIVCVDLPFGKTHKAKATTLSTLYELSVGAAARVCRPGGVLVALTTHKHLLSRVVRAGGRWEPVSRHELSFGGLTANAIIARRRR